MKSLEDNEVSLASYSVSEVARMFAVNPKSVIRWIKSGKLPNAYKPGETEKSHWRIPRSDVDNILQKRYGQ